MFSYAPLSKLSQPKVASLDYVLDRENPLFAKLAAFLPPA